MIGLFHRTFYADANLFHQDSSVRQVIPDQRIHCMSCRWPVESSTQLPVELYMQPWRYI